MVEKQCKGGNWTTKGGCDPEKKCYSCRTRTEKYMFYDFECMQETGIHKVNLAVVQDFKGNKRKPVDVKICETMYEETI